MTIYMKLNMGVGVWGSHKHDCMVEKVKETSRTMLFPTGAGCSDNSPCRLKTMIIFVMKRLDVFSVSNTFSLWFVVLLWETPLEALCHRNCATIF